MTFEYFNNFFKTPASITTTNYRKNKNNNNNNKLTRTTCTTFANICHNNNNKTSKNKNTTNATTSTTTTTTAKSSSSSKQNFHNITSSKIKIFTSTKSSSRIHLNPTALRRKIRKTSRRKRKRRRSSCLFMKQNNSSCSKRSSRSHSISQSNVNMLDNIIATRTTTTTRTLSYNKCKLSVNNNNNTRTTKESLYINKCKNYQKIIYCTTCSTSIRKTCHHYHHHHCYPKYFRNIGGSKANKCKSEKFCFCSFSKTKKLCIIVKNIVTLLLRQTRTETTTGTLVELTKTTPDIKHRATFCEKVVRKTHRKYYENHDKRKKVQLFEKEKQENQHLNYLYDLGKYVRITTTTTNLNTNINNTAASTFSTPAVNAAAEKFSSSHLTTSMVLPTITRTVETSPAIPALTALTSRPLLNSSCSLNSSTPRYSLTCWAPTRLLNDLYSVIFMTLLVLSICHNNGKFFFFLSSPFSLYFSFSFYYFSCYFCFFSKYCFCYSLLQPTKNKNK